jgi:predicted metal-binding protein
MAAPSITSRPTPWKTVILLCGKCARKLDGGYGPKRKDPLRTALQAAVRESGRRREIRIIETRCMGICPRKAVTMVNASKPGTISVVPKGTPITDVMALIPAVRPIAGNAQGTS